MRVVVLGDGEPWVRRALDDLGRSGVLTEVTTVPASSSVGDLVDAAVGVDVILAGSLDSRASMRVPLAAIAARRHAVVPAWSAADQRDHLELHADAKEVGITIMSGASASPAIPVLLARHAAKQFDEVRLVEVSWALPPDALADLATARAVVEGSVGLALVREEAAFSSAPAGHTAPVAFPEPVGIARAGLFGGAEVWRLPDTLPGRPSVRVQLAGTAPWFWFALRAASLLGRAGRTDAAAAALSLVMSRVARLSTHGSWAGVRVSLEGRVGTSSRTVVVGGFDNIDTWNAGAMVLAVSSLARGEAGPGVVVPGSDGDTTAALQQFHDAGIRFAALDDALSPPRHANG